MEWFRQWLIGITVAAMLNAAAKSLMPKGIVRQIGALTGGLVVLLAILQPVYRLDESRVEEVFFPYIGTTESYMLTAQTDTGSLMRDIIEEECGAYIQDKAKELGLECMVTVVCEEEGEGYPYPKQALVEGRLSQTEKELLSAMIAQDLGIEEQNQTYRTESGEKE